MQLDTYQWFLTDVIDSAVLHYNRNTSSSNANFFWINGKTVLMICYDLTLIVGLSINVIYLI